ncbi:M1 family metallopeptidase [Rhodovulum sp. YEN HP10]|uniref:M1 family metallopeptidase n=1 Tax=Rhodovulum sp. HP10 TaxID=3387397 RepID=UPI0039E1A880
MRLRPLVLAALPVLAALSGPSGTPALAGPNGEMLGAETVRLSLDPASGAMTLEALLPAPQGDVALPRQDWLNIETLRIGGEPSPLPASGVIRAARHMGRPVTVRLSGTLPELSPGIEAAARGETASYLMGSGWLPVDAAPRVRFELSLDVPTGWRPAATGTLSAETAHPDGRRADFVFTGRAGDLGVFAGRYAVNEAMHRGLRLRTYFEPRDAAFSPAYIAASAAYIDRYSAAIGPYPYDGFSVVSAPIPVGLGLPGMTYVSQAILGHGYMRGRSLAHEVLHSWWGNAVAVDYRRGNWSEGLTTYMADYALAEEAGAAEAREMRLGWLRDLTMLPAAEDRPLTEFRAAAHGARQAVGYGKAAFLFHMLRAELGEEDWQAGLRRFYAERRDRVAAWHDLRAGFEAASGRELRWFFDQWLTRSGLPALRIEAVEPEERALHLVLGQSAPAYQLRVPVMVETEAGTERHLVALEDGRVEVTLALGARPRSVAVDPDFELARALAPGEVPPMLGDLFAGSEPALLALGEGAAEVATALGARLLQGAPPLVDEAAAGAAPVLVVIGSGADVAAWRRAHLSAPAPWSMDAGRARAWVERDAQGRLIGFLSADRTEDLLPELGALRYQAGRSYAAFVDGAVVAAGDWPAGGSALRRRFD